MIAGMIAAAAPQAAEAAGQAAQGGAIGMSIDVAVIIFVLAMFVGLEMITKVPVTLLHTPLMSGSNAISGITIVGRAAGGRAGRLDGGRLSARWRWRRRRSTSSAATWSPTACWGCSSAKIGPWGA